MRLHIVFDFRGGRGGGSRFLHSLRKQLREMNAYAERPTQAQGILFNSHNNVLRVGWLKLMFPGKAFVQRVDGPMSRYTERDDTRDQRVRWANRWLADGTIFQSTWSQRENYALGLIDEQKPATVVYNAPDPKLFNRAEPGALGKNHKIKLISTAWSMHPNKGGETLRWLDEHLDFSRYEMTVVGRVAESFKNIQMVPFQESAELAALLKQHHIFIFPSKIEACSNALLEALHCGLPVVAYDGSSNPEIVGSAGELFAKLEEIPALLQQITDRYEQYQPAEQLPALDLVAQAYLDFTSSLVAGRQRKTHQSE